MSSEIKFFAAGIPTPQGSKRAITNKHTGSAALVESSNKNKCWRAVVSYTAAQAMRAAKQAVQTGPVMVDLAFWFPRPRGHFGTGKNAGTVKPSAPGEPQTPPDLDKLIRSVCDALSGIVYKDDRQICSIRAHKSYVLHGQPPGVEVKIYEKKANS